MTKSRKSKKHVSALRNSSTEKRQQKGDWLTNATNVLSSGIAGGIAPAVISGTGAQAVLGGLILASLPPLLTFAVTSLVRQRTRSLEVVVREAFTAPPGSDERTHAEQLFASREEPWSHETIVQAVRAQLDAVDERVAPALGRLAREYLRLKKRPDRFFRGVARLLGDLEDGEFEAFKTLIQTAKEFKDQLQSDPRYQTVDIELLAVANHSPMYFQVRSLVASSNSTTLEASTGVATVRLGRLMLRNDLVRETASGNREQSYNERNVLYLMSQDYAARLHAILSDERGSDPSTSATEQTSV